jgi:hypothetical protein
VWDLPGGFGRRGWPAPSCKHLFHEIRLLPSQKLRGKGAACDVPCVPGRHCTYKEARGSC